MKYFTKYIAVEGEIKEQDYYHHPDHPNTLFRFYEPWDHKKDKAYKVKLFLCSRDIQVGDKYFNQMNKEHTCASISEGDGKNYYPKETLVWHKNVEAAHTTFWNKLSECFKVIGEVSPNALWVKEGMEFDESEVSYIMRHYGVSSNYPGAIEYKEGGYKEPFYYVHNVEFKCPTCNTYH